MNSARSGLKGFNAKPLPPGQVSVAKNGALNVNASGGRKYVLRADGKLSSYSGPNGHTATFRPDGSMARCGTPNIQIHHGLNGGRTIVTEGKDHTRLVSDGPHSGYLQHTVIRNNTTIIQRTYVYNGSTHTRCYTPYTYTGCGCSLTHYVPPDYYPPPYYGWCGREWGTRTTYNWGWRESHWCHYYNGYYTPLDVYPSPAFWIADSFLGTCLQTAWATHHCETCGYSTDYLPPDIPDYPATDTPATCTECSQAPITPAIRQLIAEEVQEQIAAESAAASNPAQAANLTELPAVLEPNHVFVATTNLDVLTDQNQECGVTTGNVLQLNDTPQGDTALLTVLSAVPQYDADGNRTDCAAGSVVTLSIEQLQDMHTSFRQGIVAGMDQLRSQAGTNGLPAIPADAAAPVQPSGVGDVSPDPNVQAMLDKLQQDADQTEQQVTQAAFAPQ